MKKFDGKHRKKLSRRKKYLQYMRATRAAALRVSPQGMDRILAVIGDPLARANTSVTVTENLP